MANNGWAKLGEALAGTSPAQRADIEAKTIQALAGRDRAMAGARMDIEKARALDGLGSYLTQMGIENGDAVAGTQRAGVNLNTLYGGLSKQQNMGFRQAARDTAVGGDMGGANAELFGIANGPVALPQVSGGVLLSNKFLPGGGDMSVTPVGQAQIGADNARGRAAIIRAERPPASRASGGSSGAPKMGEIQKMRMQAELAPINAQIAQASEVVARNEPGMSGSTPSVYVQASERLRRLQEAQSAVFDKYAGGGAGGVADAILPPADFSGVTSSVMGRRDPTIADIDVGGDTYYNDPNTGEIVKAPPPAKAAPSAPITRQARDKKTGKVVTFTLRNGQWVQ